MLLIPACVSGSFPDGVGIKIPGCGVQQREKQLAESWAQARVSALSYILSKDTSLRSLWNVELECLSLQRDFAHLQSEWRSEEGRPGVLRVPHHSTGTGEQVGDTCALNGLSFSTFISWYNQLFVYIYLCVLYVRMCFCTCSWSQRELLAVGEDLWVFVRVCGSTVQQVSCLYARCKTSHSTRSKYKCTSKAPSCCSLHPKGQAK